MKISRPQEASDVDSIADRCTAFWEEGSNRGEAGGWSWCVWLWSWTFTSLFVLTSEHKTFNVLWWSTHPGDNCFYFKHFIESLFQCERIPHLTLFFFKKQELQPQLWVYCGFPPLEKTLTVPPLSKGSEKTVTPLFMGVKKTLTVQVKDRKLILILMNHQC